MVSAPSPDEIERQFTGLSRGRFGRIAPERIARHVLAMVGTGADYALRKAALDALARRYGFAQRDGLQMVGSAQPGVLGVYRTESPPERARAALRPYDTALLSVEPLRTSCACADFVRSSLGLCKHGLVIVEALEKSGALQRAPLPASSPTLSWDPQQPTHGDADRLARIRVHGHEALAPGDLRSPAQRLAWITRLERAGVSAEPAVSTVLREERARAERRLENEPNAAACLEATASLRRTLYPYQREGVQRFFELGRMLLADDMGLGKTTQAVAVCHGLFHAGRIQRGLLIVPAALKAQWKREWDATTDVPLTLVEGSPGERAKLYKHTSRGVLAVGYEQLVRDQAQVQKFAPELVVLDEAQRIKNWATKSALYVKALAPTYRLVLTGTPMENRFDELASIMDFVDDLALEPKWRLVPLHTVPAGEGSKAIAGARNLDVLRARLSGAMLRRVRRDVLTQLPSRTDTRVPVELSDVQREHHDDLRQPIGELSAKAARRALAPSEFMQLMQLLTRQRMICNGMAQVQFEATWPRCQGSAPTPDLLASLFTPKLAVLRGLLENVVLGQKRKAVVFSQWRNMLTLAEWSVRDLLAAQGLSTAFFTGAESHAERERALVQFHEDPTVAVLFLSDAGGTGLNLQRAASCCINLELPWNPAVLEQRIARIHRLGQTSPIDVYNLVSEEGIEGRIATALATKSALFKSLFDGDSDEVRFEGAGSFLDTVQKLVDPLPELTRDDAEEASADREVLMAQEPASAVADGTPPTLTLPDVPLPGLEVTRLADGGLRVEASPALAPALAAWLASLAR